MSSFHLQLDKDIIATQKLRLPFFYHRFSWDLAFVALGMSKRFQANGFLKS